MGEVHRLQTPRRFGLQAAGRLKREIFAPWVQDLSLLVESVEAVRPPGAAPDWQPGAIVRLPFSKKARSDGAVVCSQALMALADTAMVIACLAAWSGYRPMSTIDQTTHFLRPVNFDILADARVVRIGRNTSFGRVMLIQPPTSGRSAWWRAPIRCCELRRGAAGCAAATGFPSTGRASKLALLKAAGGRVMHRKLLIAFGLAVAVTSGALASGAGFAGPGRGVTGNDTGGIFPYSPEVETIYQDIADAHCARWARLAKVTSIHRKYGDYVSFVCYDRPGRVH